MTKELPVRGKYGAVIIVDDDDYERLKNFKIYMTPAGYPYRQIKGDDGRYKNILIYREIMGVKDPRWFVDHINRNTMDNRKENLRICTQEQNNRNRSKVKRRATKYRYKGVERHDKGVRWKSYILVSRKKVYLSTHATEEEAAMAYNAAAQKYYGEFAVLNEIMTKPAAGEANDVG